MAAVGAYPDDTPSRLLRRVQQLEDMELPSLPSIQHDIEFESEDVSGDSSAFDHSEVLEERNDEKDMATPHPLRQVYRPPSTSSELSTSTTGSPFPPLPNDHMNQTPSPYVPSAALTSTPVTMQSTSRKWNTASMSVSDQTRSTMRTNGHTRTESGNTNLGSSTGTGRERWQTPGEMSHSFSGDEIQTDGLSGFGQGQVKAANQEMSSMDPAMMSPDQSTDAHLPMETPLRRLSSGNVVLNRRGKRSNSNSFTMPLQAVPEIDVPSPIESVSEPASSPPMPSPRLSASVQDRIPSLSRSEVSGSDTSAAASTPEGPSRNPKIATPRSTARPVARQINWEDLGVEEPATDYTEDEYTEEEPASQDDLGLPSLGSMMPEEIASPMKATPISSYSTPGVARLQSRHNSPGAFEPTPRPSTALRDVTKSLNKTPLAVPFTPAASSPKDGEVSTPRAPLDDGERRKSHVLAVLGSTGLPSRTWRNAPRGTPHPLRRVSMPPNTGPISEAGSSSFQRSVSMPWDDSIRLPEITYDQSVNDSFASIASSADLTTDRRVTTHRPRFSRGNTSFPTILLPTGGASPAHNSMRGASESRADGIKIHKHLNAMNKQLLDTNAELAREAEAWKGEVERLQALLRDNGVEVEDTDIAAQLEPQARSQNRLLPGLAAVRRRRSLTPGEGSAVSRIEGLSSTDQAALIDEMMEKLEQLEATVNEKEQVILDLEEQIRSGAAGDEAATILELQARIDDLTGELEDVDLVREGLKADFATKTEQHAKQFGEICATFEEEVKSLQAKLGDSEVQVRRLQDDRERLEGLQAEDSDGQLESERKRRADLEEQLREAQNDLQALGDEAAALKRETEAAVKLRGSAEARSSGLQTQLDDLAIKLERAEAAAADLSEIRAQLDELNATKDNAITSTEKEELDELRRLNQEIEDELDARDKEVDELGEQFAHLEEQLRQAQSSDSPMARELGDEIDRLETALDAANKRLAHAEAELEAARAVDKSTQSEDGQQEAIANMEGHLEEAFREIGRLKNQLAASPHLKSTLETRDARIKSLEREKAALQDRLSGMRESTPVGVQNAASPFKATPFVHKAIASLRQPKTPGTLPEMSWLQSTVGDGNESVLRAQIDYLQEQLESANGNLDANFSRLEAAGLNGVQLAELLAVAQDRISELEDELRSMTQHNQDSHPSAHQRRTDDARLKRAMEAVNQQMESLQADLNAERARLQRENERLSSLVADVRRDHRDDLDAMRAESEAQIHRLENDVKRAKNEASSAVKERDSLRNESALLESQLRDVERQLTSKKAAYDSLTRQQARMESSSQLDEQRNTIFDLEDQLRAVRCEADDLQHRLKEKESKLTAAETEIAELVHERDLVEVELQYFEKDLNEQRKDAEAFGVQLELLRETGKNRDDVYAAEKETRRVSDELTRVERQLESIRREHKELARWKDRHACDSGSSGALDEQKARWKMQSQELAVQIRYLKAKFTRESTFRNALALQKRYLLLLVGGMSLNEQATLKQIASMGFPAPALPRKRHTFKAVGIAVLGTIRARNAAAAWRSERQVKSQAIAAREERKRISP